jgi:flavin-dependent dehydrogenase
VDVEIVGASFAGLTCARICAAHGLPTVVWERKREPGQAVRTTGILVREAVDEEEPPIAGTRRIHGVRLFGPSLAHVDLEAPGYTFLATDTPALLRELAGRAADAGADLRFASSFPEVRTGRLLVGADGPRSTVATLEGLGRNRRFLVGIEAEFEGVEDLEERLHIFLDSELAPGYIGWVVPGVGITQIGLATRLPARPDLERFLRRAARVVDLSGATRVGARGGPIPVGGTVRPFASEDAVLVGDAAGLVSPLTADGIHTALSSGRVVAQAIVNHLLDGGPALPVALAGIYPRFVTKRLLRRLLDLRPPNAAIDLALASDRFPTVASRVFFDRTGGRSPVGASRR